MPATPRHDAIELLLREGRLTEAESAARRLATEQPEDAAAHHLLGAALRRAGRSREAIPPLLQATSIDPSRIDAFSALALALEEAGERERAVEAMRLALRLHPGSADLHTVLGNLLRRAERFDEAERAHGRALELAPESPEVLSNVVLLELARGRLEAALAVAGRALAVAPGHPELLFNRGTVLLRLGRLDEAEEALRAALASAPALARAHVNLGEVAMARGTLEAAAGCFRAAIAAEPENAEAHWNLGMALLAAGRLEEGYGEYEWRRRLFPLHARTEAPPWRGEPLPGGALLVYAEQGLGDTIQFARYLALARERSGARLVLECPPVVARLLRRCAGIDDLVPRGAPLPPVAALAPLLSVPRLCGASPAEAGRAVPYLSAEPELAARWAARLRSPARLRIGIGWQGNPSYRADAMRSPPLRHFAALARLPGVELISLQKGAGQEQLASAPPELRILDLGRELDLDGDAFVDTAAVLGGLDLVVCSDTALAHLAGALGRETWLLLAHAPDWRWGRRGEGTDWYPTMRLFRAEQASGWEGVVARVEAALRRRLG